MVVLEDSFVKEHLMSAVGPMTQQGIISTQIERTQNDRPAVVQTPPPETTPRDETPPPPPVETGRGATIDTTA